MTESLTTGPHVVDWIPKQVALMYLALVAQVKRVREEYVERLCSSVERRQGQERQITVRTFFFSFSCFKETP